MKKILLLSLPMLAMCFASCEKNNEEVWTDDSPIIQFKDPKFLNAVLNYGVYEQIFTIDKNNDGQISEKEASIMTSLAIVGKGIRNLEEIKYFTALEYLGCGDNALSSLDLSKNTALTELNCNDNQLTSLDVSKNAALTNLSCSNNQLTSLDVSNCTALKYLDCEDNQLTSLDLSKNTALTELNCNDNQLTSLDVSKNAALTNLSCSNNQLTSLDLSKNTALTALSCSNNQLTSLDMSKNIALYELWCYSNPLTSLDVSMCHDLHNLGCVDWTYKGGEVAVDLSTKCPLTSLKIYKYHMLRDSSVESLEKAYGNGDIIEYVE